MTDGGKFVTSVFLVSLNRKVAVGFVNAFVNGESCMEFEVFSKRYRCQAAHIGNVMTAVSSLLASCERERESCLVTLMERTYFSQEAVQNIFLGGVRDGSLERLGAEADAMEEGESMRGSCNCNACSVYNWTADTENRSQDTCGLHFSCFFQEQSSNKYFSAVCAT